MQRGMSSPKRRVLDMARNIKIYNFIELFLKYSYLKTIYIKFIYNKSDLIEYNIYQQFEHTKFTLLVRL